MVGEAQGRPVSPSGSSGTAGDGVRCGRSRGSVATNSSKSVVSVGTDAPYRDRNVVSTMC